VLRSLLFGASAALLAASLGAQTLPNQRPGDPLVPVRPATTPPGKDTTGYWQQEANYQIVATLDEALSGVRATGVLQYINHSPDTLRELWLHQHLNAFRPGSRWSAVDEQEGRTRFQRLADPDYAYERFVAAPTVRMRGAARAVTVRPEYPLASDSSVVRLALPTALLPGDTVHVTMHWTARPSTLARRQGRRGRSFDFAQWYPRVAVYDRDGWKPNATVPAGEFYGEYGRFTVTMLVRDDQVLGATGVVIAGDPGWRRVAVGGAVPVMQNEAYSARGALAIPATTRVPAGHRAVTFYAENVHHFAWSASPGFVYEGGAYVRPARAPRPGVRVWDTVAVHVLYRGDAAEDCASIPAPANQTADARARSVAACVVSGKTGWENGSAVRNGLSSLAWLEQVFGPYAYPQMTILKRIDGGGTEFPMMMHNGSNSAGLVTHEGGHIFAHGMLGNNEWQSGWMDEGLTSYQTAWQTGTVRPVIAAALRAAGGADPLASPDSANRLRRTGKDAASRTRATAFRTGRLQPMGTRSDAFRDFSTYNTAAYTRGQEMYEALHDLIGDAPFKAFLNDYFARWVHRHVDRWAMQGSAERASGMDLEWFFDQWVDQAGTIEYVLRDPSVERTATGWRTTVTLVRTGTFRHAMPVAVRTSDGWTVVRGAPLANDERVVIETAARPEAIWLDPWGATESPAMSLVIPADEPASAAFTLEETTIAQIHAAFRTGALTCRGLVQQYLDRIDAIDKRGPAINAVVLVNPEALARADSLDAVYRANGPVGPLHCIPVAVKDNFETKGLQTTGGSVALYGWRPLQDATMVAKIRAAGAVVLMKTNMAEWAFTPYETVSSILPGYTRNPYALDRVTAGSSGGTAAAVAANEAAIGLGTDTGNSIRGPSAHNALVGIRSTMGLTSRGGVIPLNNGADIAGPMARTVADAVAVFDVVVGSDPADPVTAPADSKREKDYNSFVKAGALRGAKIGVLRQAYERTTTDAEVVMVFNAAVEDLRRAGATIVAHAGLDSLNALMRTTGGGCNPFKYDLERYFAARAANAPVKTIRDVLRSGGYHPTVQARLQAADEVTTPPESTPGCQSREQMRERFRVALTKMMDSLGVDALVYPTWSNPPRLIGDLNTPHGDNSQLFSPTSGFPSITVPMGYTRANTLPAGITFLGRAWSEGRLIGLAYGYEQAAPHRRPPSP